MPDAVVCRFDQLIEGRGRPAVVDGRYLAVFLFEGRIAVVDNACRHLELPLDGGAIDDGILTCPWHGWRYEMTSVADGAGELRSYPARVVDGVVVAILD